MYYVLHRIVCIKTALIPSKIYSLAENTRNKQYSKATRAAITKRGKNHETLYIACDCDTTRDNSKPKSKPNQEFNVLICCDRTVCNVCLIGSINGHLFFSQNLMQQINVLQINLLTTWITQVLVSSITVCCNRIQEKY